jgi:hypothetical protein
MNDPSPNPGIPHVADAADAVGDQMREWSLAQSHPAQRALTFAAANLLGLFGTLHREIAKAMTESETPLETCDDLGGEVELMIRLGRQAERFMTVARTYTAPLSGSAKRQRGSGAIHTTSIQEVASE